MTYVLLLFNEDIAVFCSGESESTPVHNKGELSMGLKPIFLKQSPSSFCPECKTLARLKHFIYPSMNIWSLRLRGLPTIFQTLLELTVL